MTRNRIDFEEDARVVAMAKIGVHFYDYTRHKTVAVPGRLADL
jgi:hypothetical protein